MVAGTNASVDFPNDALPELQEQWYKYGSNKQKYLHIYGCKTIENSFRENEDVTTVLSAIKKKKRDNW